jgi:hypothetical protein
MGNIYGDIRGQHELELRPYVVLANDWRRKRELEGQYYLRPKFAICGGDTAHIVQI